LQSLAAFSITKDSHCLTDDGKGKAFFRDPQAGTILEIKD